METRFIVVYDDETKEFETFNDAMRFVADLGSELEDVAIYMRTGTINQLVFIR